MRGFLNILIQFVWVAVSLIIGGYISVSVFESPFWKSTFSGVFAILVYCLLYIIVNSIKACRDPDVRAASSLGMTVARFHHYQRLFDEYQDFMEKHGSESRESEEKFKEIFKQIKNPNEWRRYSKYRENKQNKEIKEMINSNYRLQI